MKNVVYITVDSLRADHVGFNGYDRDTTPNLDSVASENITVRNCFANGPYTSFAFPPLFSSRLPLSDSNTLGIREAPDSLPEIFSDQGYATGGFNAGNPYLTEVYGYTRGFDTFRDYLRGSERKDSAFGKVRSVVENNELLFNIAKPINDRARILKTRVKTLIGADKAKAEKTPPAARIDAAGREWLDRTDGPFFLWLHYMDPHTVFDPADQYLREFTDRSIPAGRRMKLWKWMFEAQDRFTENEQNLRDLIDLYDATIREVDASVGRVLDHLDSNDQVEETVVVFTGDHGEEFLDHGDMGHGGYLYDTHLSVPLLLKSPEVDAHTVDSTISHLDLPPTILDAADVPAPSSFLGRSIWPEILSGEYTDRGPIPLQAFRGPRTDVVEFDQGTLRIGFRTPEDKYIMNFEDDLSVSDGWAELYDLSADPREHSSLAAEEGAAIERYNEQCRSHMGTLNGIRGATEELATSDAVEERLEDLGYK